MMQRQAARSSGCSVGKTNSVGRCFGLQSVLSSDMRLRLHVFGCPSVGCSGSETACTCDSGGMSGSDGERFAMLSGAFDTMMRCEAGPSDPNTFAEKRASVPVPENGRW